MAAAQAAANAVIAAGSLVATRCYNGANSSANARTSVVISSAVLKPCNLAISPFTSGSSLERARSFSIVKEKSTGVAASATKLEVAPAVEEEKEVKATESPAEVATEASVSSFMTDVANLVKLVDSRDIVELEMKHKDYEIIIRKKEALAPPPAPPASFPGPHVMAHTSFPGYPGPPLSPPPAVTTPAPEETAPAEAPPTAAPTSQHTSMLSPMAGTFYRSPGPGEPPFVHVGDKVTKGQVVCIVEAMKLMNEIEADQSGTIVEIAAEDGKPVSIESPLFIIKP
ncbi:hypothetical protein R1sor_010144 [Riccia sorocarpa]|uniref:Biotin carboxyl carrier protein of acetyl-CoA carboxylase n=1 Tax=Riccia sorocarpa TaxID=122646 RepID=A0ABD3HXF0_9MARC